MHIRYRRRRTGLQSRRGEDALLLRQCGQVLRLLQAVAERPFAVHGLARLQLASAALEAGKAADCERPLRKGFKGGGEPGGPAEEKGGPAPAGQRGRAGGEGREVV